MSELHRQKRATGSRVLLEDRPRLVGDGVAPRHPSFVSSLLNLQQSAGNRAVVDQALRSVTGVGDPARRPDARTFGSRRGTHEAIPRGAETVLSKSDESVRRKVVFDPANRTITKARFGAESDVDSKVYKTQLATAHALEAKVKIEEMNTGGGAEFWKPGERSEHEAWPHSIIVVSDTEIDQPEVFNSTVAQLGHELGHFLDFCAKADWSKTGDDEQQDNVMKTEWRAWALQSAVVFENRQADRPSREIDMSIQEEFEKDQLLLLNVSDFWRKSKEYLKSIDMFKTDSGSRKPDDHGFEAWLDEGDHRKWVDEARSLYVKKTAPFRT